MKTIIEKLYDLSDEECTTLFKHECSDYSIEIRAFESFQWLTINGVAIQSLFDTQNQAHIFNPVNAFMLCALSLPNKQERVLNLGLGGASIERFLTAEFPEISIDSIEINEHIIHIARDYFYLPYDHAVYHVPAEEFLQQTDVVYSHIFCDIFNNEQHPSCLHEHLFYQHIMHALSDDGIFILNLLGTDQAELILILKTLRCYLPNTTVLSISDHDNIIVYAQRNRFSLNEDAMKKRFSLFLSKRRINTIPFNWHLTQLPDRTVTHS